MREEIEDWLLALQLNGSHLWELVREVRGVAKDRAGRWYWKSVYEYRPDHFVINVIPWPGLTHMSRSTGWTSVGKEDGKDTWMIYDLRVPIPQRERGIATILVRAGIDLARRRGARVLRGVVTKSDAQTNPFLPEWYARLGFTVSPAQGDMLAHLWMDLASRPLV